MRIKMLFINQTLISYYSTKRILREIFTIGIIDLFVLCSSGALVLFILNI
jgi:hypothetical protein